MDKLGVVRPDITPDRDGRIHRDKTAAELAESEQKAAADAALRAKQAARQADRDSSQRP